MFLYLYARQYSKYYFLDIDVIKKNIYRKFCCKELFNRATFRRLKTLIKMHLVSGVLHHFSEILKIFKIAPVGSFRKILSQQARERC